MATKAIPATEADKDQPDVQEATTQVPGVGSVTTYWRIEHQDDLTGKAETGLETIRLRVPVEAERETVERDAEGDPLKNDDGTDKITVVKFIDYESREIDLGPASRTKLFKALAPFYAASREGEPEPVSAPVGIRSRTGRKTPEDDLAAIREWAQKAGHDVKDRGRVPQHIKDAYYLNNPDKRPTE